MFLVEKMGFGWEQVHDIAEQIEHIQSPEFFAKMDELLGFPKLDPHGSPIPDKNGKMVWKEYSKLSECKAGDTIKLSAVINTSAEFLKFLNSRELSLGLKLKIKSVEPFDNTMVVSYGKRLSETLSHTVCERLLVEKV
jgi:DtxR family Mn-dependent transcriptional regulator